MTEEERRELNKRLWEEQKSILGETDDKLDVFITHEQLSKRRRMLFDIRKEYLGEDKPINRIIPIVSVCIPTFNHKDFIEECLNGALTQITSFPYEIIICDDGSYDGTAEICRKYAEKHKDKIRLYDHNRSMTRLYDSNGKPIEGCNWFWALESARGEYIAICEGDDYWIDKLKLQKQVDFLYKNLDFGLVHSELNHYYVKNGKFVKNHWQKSGVKNQSGDLYDSLLGGGKSMIYACTVCFRRDLILDIDFNKFSKYISLDVPLWLHIAANSKIGYLNESTAVRNVLNYSATQGRDFNYKLKFIQSSLHVFNDYNSLRPFSREAAYNFKQRYSSNICNLCYQFGERYDLFDENYKNLDNRYRTLNLILKRFFFKYRIPKIISRLILKMTNILFPSKIN